MTVLYRKYRPKSFSEVVGQEHIIKTIQNALKSDDLAHAYLFTGPRGTGKTTTARLLTKALNCSSSSNADACVKCDNCLEIEGGSFVDLIEIDAASNRGIDEIRELKENVRFYPNKGKYKVYLIDEVHMLTKEAFNALLKTLEEPPSHAIFILATTEPHKVLPTIISRTQRFDFRYLNADEISSRLAMVAKKEKRKIDAGAIKMVVSASGGSLRDAESIFGKVLSLEDPNPEEIRTLLGLTSLEEVAKLFDYFISNDKESAIKFATEISEGGGDIVQFINSSIDYARTLLISKLSPSSEELLTANFSDEEKKKASYQLNHLTEKRLYDIIRAFVDAANEVKYSPLPQLPLELAIADIIGIDVSNTT